MSSLPWFLPPILHSFGRYSAGRDMDPRANLSIADNVNWPAANRIVYAPLFLPIAATVKRAVWCNGNAVNGSFMVAVYDNSMRLIAATPSTAQSGTGTAQYVNFQLGLPRGTYWMGLIGSGTGRIAKANPAVYALSCGAFYEDPGSFAFPATMTPTLYTASSYCPLFGLDLRGT